VLQLERDGVESETHEWLSQRERSKSMILDEDLMLAESMEIKD
jgi:hypothetical protein